ncbi:MAG TPA: dihydrolipoyl dehydrogenase [Candidatus Nanoarchaeia archaeon]|nr:dihydrolipoyl dehydrogenase [Candidatus Nanoarchaeia archaeon]
MKRFDVIVIGAGSGLNVANAAAEKGLNVAVVEPGPMGGTCLNRGCIPSKIIIHAADVAETIRNSEKFHIKSRLISIDFKSIIREANKIVGDSAKHIEEGIKGSENFTLFKEYARFVGERRLKVGDEVIEGDKIIIAAGTRPMTPKIEGLDKIDYMTSDEGLKLEKLPKKLIVLGGGYIACELAHFYSAMGSDVTIVQRSDHLLTKQDEEIARKFTEVFSRRINVLTNHTVEKVEKKNGQYALTLKGKTKKISGDALLVAQGRISNADTLDLEKAGVKTTKEGFIKVNEFLETSAKNVWAFGDIAGIYQLKHSANLEGEYCAQNAFGGKKVKVDYTAMPFAIFTNPQIAGVGMTETELKEKKIHYKTGRYDYIRTGMGKALKDYDGFVKVLVDKKKEKILGCHIIGTDASSIIHEVIVAMKNKNNVKTITDTIHIHPALPEVVERAFLNIED